MNELTTITVSAVVGAIVAFAGAYARQIVDARGELSQDTRAKRQGLYEELWNHTGLLPLWPKDLEVTYRDIERLTKTLKTWYFERGGIYLSTEARETYGAAQETMCQLVTLRRQQLGKPLSAVDYNDIREHLSSLRTQITLDLSSRRRSPFGS